MHNIMIDSGQYFRFLWWSFTKVWLKFHIFSAWIFWNHLYKYLSYSSFRFACCLNLRHILHSGSIMYSIFQVCWNSVFKVSWWSCAFWRQRYSPAFRDIWMAIYFRKQQQKMRQKTHIEKAIHHWSNIRNKDQKWKKKTFMQRKSIKKDEPKII